MYVYVTITSFEIIVFVTIFPTDFNNDETKKGSLARI